MYPPQFLEFAKFREANSDVSVLPTPAFFYGLLEKEEITIDLEPGKTLFARLLNVTEADANGQRTAIFELNGYPRHVQIADKSIAKEVVKRAKADPGDPHQVGAPMPGLVATIAVSVGQKVKEGDNLVTLEAMKMFTTITAPMAGTVAEICVTVGTTVESKDLLLKLGK
jgi:pyruvate carboxylase